MDKDVGARRASVRYLIFDLHQPHADTGSLLKQNNRDFHQSALADFAYQREVSTSQYHPILFDAMALGAEGTVLDSAEFVLQSPHGFKTK
jgi:hypothetical protein